MQTFYQQYSRFSHAVNIVAEAILVACLVIMTLSTSLQVCLRYTIHTSLSWPEEVNLLLMPWVTFIGSSVAMRRAEHIGITIFVEKLPHDTLGRVIRIIGYLLIGLVLGILITVSWQVAMKYVNAYSDAVRIPLVWSRISMAIGSGFMCVQLLQLIMNEFAGKEQAS